MKLLPRSTYSAFLSLLLLPALTAADKASIPPEPSGNAILARFVEVSGGESAIRQKTARLSKGRISLPAMGVNGDLEILQATGGKTVQTFVLGPGVSAAMGTDGSLAWMNIPGIGVQEMEGDQRRQFMEDADLFRMLQLGKRFTRTEVKSPQKLGPLECDVVVGNTREGKTETLYFDRATGLLLRWDREMLTQTGSWSPGETWWEDYRTVDGLKLPFKVRQPKPESGAFEIEISEIQHGVPTPDEKFKKPAA